MSSPYLPQPSEWSPKNGGGHRQLSSLLPLGAVLTPFVLSLYLENQTTSPSTTLASSSSSSPTFTSSSVAIMVNLPQSQGKSWSLPSWRCFQIDFDDCGDCCDHDKNDDLEDDDDDDDHDKNDGDDNHDKKDDDDANSNLESPPSLLPLREALWGGKWSKACLEIMSLVIWWLLLSGDNWYFWGEIYHENDHHHHDHDVSTCWQEELKPSSGAFGPFQRI